MSAVSREAREESTSGFGAASGATVSPAGERAGPPRSPAQADCGDAPAPPRVARGPRILLVDDDPEIALFLELLFELEGFTLEVAASGADLRARLAAPGIDAVLLDITLPDADGLYLCSALKADPSTRALPVLVVSALPGDEVARRAAQAGANEYLSKPFENAELIRRLRRYLPRSAPPG